MKTLLAGINTKRILLSFAVLLTAYSLQLKTYSLFAAFKDSGWGVRPLGMAGAFTAVADDANAPLYNPAGFALVKGEEVSLMSANLYSGLEGVDIGLTYMGYVHSLGKNSGGIGFAWGALSSPGLYREDTVSLGYGIGLNNLFKFSGPRISIGANARYLKHAYTLDERTVGDPVFANGTTASATTGDAGIIVGLPKQGLAFALAARSATSPDVGLLTVDKVPEENVFGVSYHTDKLSYLKFSDFTTALDVVSRDNNVDVRLGFETWFFNDKFAVRAGARPQDITFGLGYSVKFASKTELIVDYSFAWPLEIENTTGSHRIGLSIRFP